MTKLIELKNDHTLIRLNDGTRIIIDQDKDSNINEISINHHKTLFDNDIEVAEVSKRESFENTVWSVVRSKFVSKKNKDYESKTIVAHVAFEK